MSGDFVPQKELEKLVHDQTSVMQQMSISLEGATTRMTTSVDELRKEVQELRDTRFRPYITSMGMFVAVSIAVTGYVYGLERRTSQAFFSVTNSIGDLETMAQVNTKHIGINSDRSLARQEHALNRENSHNRLHENLEQRLRDYYEALLHIARSCDGASTDAGE